jgi:glycosyltransferase involved in cell wall biosynthesis
MNRLANPLIEIFTVIKNGEYILPLYLKHYKEAFPGCNIVIFDNNSTDQSVELCQAAGCVVANFPKFTVEIEQQFKNSVWKKSLAKWVVICDQDELLQITSADLEALPENVNVIKFKGYNMIDVDNKKDPALFTHGSHSETYDKCCMFKPSLKEINFSPGSHFANPIPNAMFSKYQFNLLHYNKSWFTFDNFCEKHSKAFRKDLETVYNISLKSLVKVNK